MRVLSCTLDTFNPTSRNFNQLSVPLHKTGESRHNFQIMTIKCLLKSPYKLKFNRDKTDLPSSQHLLNENKKNPLLRSSGLALILLILMGFFFFDQFLACRLFVPKVMVLSLAAVNHLTDVSAIIIMGSTSVQLLSFQPSCSCRAGLICGPSPPQIHLREQEPTSFQC